MRYIKPFLLISLFVNSSLLAQPQVKTEFRLKLKERDNLIGTTFGLWMRGGSPILGANYEREVKQMGIGAGGVGAILRFWSYLEKYSYAEVTYSNTFIGIQGNYNLNKIARGNFVPFAGLALGYNFISDRYRKYDETSIIAYDKTYKSGFLLYAQAGMRYFINSRVAAGFRLGLGSRDFSILELGLDIRL